MDGWMDVRILLILRGGFRAVWGGEGEGEGKVEWSGWDGVVD